MWEQQSPPFGQEAPTPPGPVACHAQARAADPPEPRACHTAWQHKLWEPRSSLAGNRVITKPKLRMVQIFHRPVWRSPHLGKGRTPPVCTGQLPDCFSILSSHSATLQSAPRFVRALRTAFPAPSLRLDRNTTTNDHVHVLGPSVLSKSTAFPPLPQP